MSQIHAIAYEIKYWNNGHHSRACTFVSTKTGKRVTCIDMQASALCGIFPAWVGIEHTETDVNRAQWKNATSDALSASTMDCMDAIGGLFGYKCCRVCNGRGLTGFGTDCKLCDVCKRSGYVKARGAK